MSDEVATTSQELTARASEIEQIAELGRGIIRGTRDPVAAQAEVSRAAGRARRAARGTR